MIKLENKDCIDFLKSLDSNSIDLCLIDPPYIISRKTNFSSGQPKGKDTDRFRVSMEFGDWDKNEEVGFQEEDFKSAINEIYRVLKKSGSIICFYDLWKITNLKEYMENAKFKQIRFIEWLKTNPVPLNSKTNYLTNAREIAIMGVKGGKPTFHSEYDNAIYSYPICHEKGRFHPTQKPVALLEELIEKHTNQGELVMDCFAGSASCAIAAYNKNRNFVGCELNKEYFEKAQQRINEYIKE